MNILYENIQIVKYFSCILIKIYKHTNYGFKLLYISITTSQVPATTNKWGNNQSHNKTECIKELSLVYMIPSAIATLYNQSTKMICTSIYYRTEHLLTFGSSQVEAEQKCEEWKED
jgi:hypothetical protein